MVNTEYTSTIIIVHIIIFLVVRTAPAYSLLFYLFQNTLNTFPYQNMEVYILHFHGCRIFHSVDVCEGEISRVELLSKEMHNFNFGRYCQVFLSEYEHC